MIHGRVTRMEESLGFSEYPSVCESCKIEECEMIRNRILIKFIEVFPEPLSPRAESKNREAYNRIEGAINNIEALIILNNILKTNYTLETIQREVQHNKIA